MRYIVIIILVSVLPKLNFAQGVELYGGYPFSIASNVNGGKVKNWGNGQLGANLVFYIRSVSIQLGGGVMTNNYMIVSPNYKGSIRHAYVFVPLMVYPRLYTDGKNTLSIGAGINAKFASKARKSVIYDDGSSPQSYYGYHTNTLAARVSCKYSRLLPHSFLFFTEIFSDVRVLNDYNDFYKTHPFPPPGYQSPVMTPYYNSRVSLGANVGIGYILPVNGKALPRYFQKREKKIKE